MTLNQSIFKAYDIRGIYGRDLDDEFAYKLGLAYCHLRREESNRDNFTFVVGRDMRLSSLSLHKNLVKGLIEGGADVIDVGLVATPTFYFSVAHYKYDGGIMISASHNPADYNGFKLVRQMASPISENSGLKDLQKIINENSLLPYSKIGKIIVKENVIKDHVNYDLAMVDTSKIKPFKIVFDSANAMGSLYFEELFKSLPQISLEKMNWDLDGTFPNHEADPFKAENVKELSEKVVSMNYDLGISTDGDSDRVFFIDEEGAAIEAGVMRAILCKLFLRDKPGATICYDIRPGKITYDTIIENKGTPLVTRVGHSLIKEAMIDSGAYFAGESSGHFILNMVEEGCYEVPGIVVLKLLIDLSKENIKLSDYIKPYKKYYHSGEISFKVDAIDEKINLLREKFNDQQPNELDGLSYTYPEVWFNIRKSNTEPLSRISIEGIAKEPVEKIKNEIIKIIS